MKTVQYHIEIIYSANKRLFSYTSRADSSLFCALSLLQVQDDLTVHVAEPRPALRQRGGEEAAGGLRLQPGHSLRQNQGLHPDTSHALQPGGAAGRHGAENRPLPAEGTAATPLVDPRNSRVADFTVKNLSRVFIAWICLCIYLKHKITV